MILELWQFYSWESPIADWDKASANIQEAYYRLTDEINRLW